MQQQLGRNGSFASMSDTQHQLLPVDQIDPSDTSALRMSAQLCKILVADSIHATAVLQNRHQLDECKTVTCFTQTGTQVASHCNILAEVGHHERPPELAHNHLPHLSILVQHAHLTLVPGISEDLEPHVQVAQVSEGDLLSSNRHLWDRMHRPCCNLLCPCQCQKVSYPTHVCGPIEPLLGEFIMACLDQVSGQGQTDTVPLLAAESAAIRDADCPSSFLPACLVVPKWR